MAPFILLTLIEIAALRNFFDFSNPFEAGGQFGLLTVVVLIISGLFAAQLMAVAWYGLWIGLTTRKPGHAVAKTIIYVVIVPLIFSFVFSCGLLWPVITIVKDVIFINRARSQLHKQFRNVVTEGAPTKTNLWKRPPAWPPKLPNVLDK